jgi:RecA/RadA recombinase
MIETKEYGWKKVSELKVGDIALTVKGELPLIKCEKVDESIVYDFEVDHKNHRYFCEGFSNHNTGKTFLSMNAAREAQKSFDSKIFWFDSEGAMDNDTLERIGVDTSNVVIVPVETIRQTSQVMLNILDSISGENSCEYMFVLDSLGNLSSDKETEDLLSGNNKRDMTKQQELKAMFRTLLTRLRVKRVPMIVTSHVYEAIGSYIPTKIISGGSGAKFGASISLMLSTRQLKKEDDKDVDTKKVDSEIKKTGVLIKSKQEKARFTKGGIPITLHVSFYKGMNKYVGLQDYLDWENCKVAPGKLVDEYEEYETGTGKIARRKTGNTVFEPHSSSQAPRSWVIGNGPDGEPIQIKTKEFWRYAKEIFTKENLDYIDSRLQEVFMFAEYDAVEEMLAEELENESHLKETVVTDDSDETLEEE